MSELKVEGVSVSYRQKRALHPVSFEAKRGQIVGFIGADGSGKSSLMHAISGVIPFEGSISFDDVVFRSPRECEPLKPKIGFMPQGIGLILYSHLSVGEHLDFFADIRGIRKNADFKAYRERLLKMARLESFVDRQAGKLSGGMMQKLSLICSLLHRPELLILDEPTTGVDPLSRLELWEILREIADKENALVLVSTAYMGEASRMDMVLLLDEGEIIAQGRVEELLKEVRPYVYAKSAEALEGALNLHNATYALEPLALEHQKPTLEALFFVNYLKKGQRLPTLSIAKKETKTVLPETIMEARGLTKRFDSFVANDHVDLRLGRGEILGLLGANGAGKTTFIKMLLGLYPMDEGELVLLGHQIKSASERQTLKERIGYVSQRFALYRDMSIRENLLYFAHMHDIATIKALKRIEEYAKTLGFAEFLDDLPANVPLGINQRLSIVAAILHEPVLLFLDEPTSGIDVVARTLFWEMIRKLRDEWGISILITTHYVAEAEFCDRIALLKDGRKIVDATVSELYQAHLGAKSFEEIFLAYHQEGQNED